MSRTDKTNPEWVGRDWKPVHSLECEDYISYHHPGYRLLDIRCRKPCDLSVEPPSRWSHPSWRSRLWNCYWEPDFPRFYTDAPEHKRYARPATVAEQANKLERGIRTAWRNARQELLSSRICVEGIPGCSCLYDVVNDVNLPDPRHRRFALWDRW